MCKYPKIKIKGTTLPKVDADKVADALGAEEVRMKTKGFEMFGEQECRQVESLIRKEFGEEYFLTVNVEECSVVKYKSLGGDVERDFGWFSSPQEAYRAAKGVLGK